MGNRFHRWASSCLSVPSQVFREQLIVLARHLIRLLRLLVVNLSFVGWKFANSWASPSFSVVSSCLPQKKSSFVFDGQYYDQIDGVAMGSPLGPVLANIFMCNFEEKWVMKNINRPSIWFRYVDDTFTLFKNKNDTLSFFTLPEWETTTLNSHWIALEQNDEIPFLDILLKRNLDSSRPSNSQHQSIERRHSQVFTASGTLLLRVNTRQT